MSSNAPSLAFVVVMACAAIALGLMPGPLRGLMEGIARFKEALRFHDPRSPIAYWRLDGVRAEKRLPGQIWLSVAGFALLVVVFLGLLWGR